jgi:CBS domain-containing protein
MSIATLCTRTVVSVDQHLPLADAARLMRDENIGALVLTAEDSPGGTRVAGIVTDRDLAIEALARGLDAATVPVGELTSGRPVAVPDYASVEQAIATMREEGLRRLLVTNEERELVGIVTLDDLIEALAEELADLATALRMGSSRRKAAPPHRAAGAGMPVPEFALAQRWRPIGTT